MTQYIGRFAPSPSGPLHLGSLVCALASYLDAKVNSGQWLLRIEDLDPPREQAQASSQIKNSLLSHALHWDGEIAVQSQRHEHYRHRLDDLLARGMAYPCNCVRKRLAILNGVYDGKCIKQPPPPNEAASLRLHIQSCLHETQLTSLFCFNDELQGLISQDLNDIGDFVIHRKDGLFAYQLAVVSDDIDQGVTHIVRGCDLLDMTAQQILLFKAFNKEPPNYTHTPILLDESGRKLSKQNHAPALNDEKASQNLSYACKALGMYPNTELCAKKPEDILLWATEQWPNKSILGQKKVHIQDIT